MNRKKKVSWGIFLLISDVIIINLGIIFAFFLRYGGKIPPFNFQAYTSLSAFITIIYIFSLYVFDLYDREKLRESLEIFSAIFKAVTFAIFLVVALTFFIRFFSFPRTVFLLSWIILILFLFLERIFLIKIFPFEYPIQRVLIVGTDESALEIGRELGKKTELGYEVIGLIFTEEKKQSTKVNGFPIIGSVKKISNLVREYNIDRVIVASLTRHREIVEDLAEAENSFVRVEVIPELYEIFIGKVDHRLISDIPLIELTKEPTPGWIKMIKRLIDIILALFLLVLSSPLILIAALMVKINSPGPVFFHQERVGFEERIFNVYKYRTMIKDAESETGPVLATEDDPRITSAGRILRKFRIDELPQLFNILRGDMSFIGPRPERPFFVKTFSSKIPGYRERYRVRPGITGLAQISGTYATTPRNKLKYDLIYIYNQSLFLDLKIFIKTINVVLTGKGAR